MEYIWIIFILFFLSLSTANLLSSGHATMSMIPVVQMTSDHQFDEQLYSRQIFVYGKSAQKQLLNAHVLIYGNGLVTAEVLKNLALAGVGKISLLDTDVKRLGPKSRLIGEENDLLQYALSLNPNLNINRDVTEETLGNHNITVVVAGDITFQEMKRINSLTRGHGIKLVCALVRGVCGVVFNDFLENHNIIDIDGEFRKEIPLLSASRMSVSTGAEEGSIEEKIITVKVNCIEEDRFTDIGINDIIEISFTKDSHKIEPLQATVTAVVNPRCLVIDIPVTLNSSQEIEQLLVQLSSTNQSILSNQKADATLKKIPQTLTISHKSLVEVLKDPKNCFTPTNGCLAPKKDKALSLTLLSAFQALENYKIPLHINPKRKLKMKSPSHKKIKRKTTIARSVTQIIEEEQQYDQHQFADEVEKRAMRKTESTNSNHDSSLDLNVDTIRGGHTNDNSISSINANDDLLVDPGEEDNIMPPTENTKQVSETDTIVETKPAADTSSETQSRVGVMHFRSAMIGELYSMGVEKPLLPIKLGGLVGNEALNTVASRFYQCAVPISKNQSNESLGVCVATVSVVGSMAAQEVIKAITQVHMPVNQLFMFESLDSLHDTDTDTKINNRNVDDSNILHESGETEREDAIFQNAVAVYGKEIAYELKKLRVFIVGAGAIGSELLKTLALMGVGSSAVNKHDGDHTEILSSDSHKIDWKNIENGGIVITDMDSIERSNLNRQLLYRERHIGSSKSLIASEMIKKINPHMNILSLTNKVCPDTEFVFNAEFWKHIDVVLPALDNVDARLYVDSLCVSKKKWLLDSGTLGTKGSTQVVIPGVTESYASSADPPEDAIPMCTLKSFPYQPEHCISWAKNLFDQLLSEDIKNLKLCVEAASQSLASQSADESDSQKSSSPRIIEFERKLNKLIDAWSPEALSSVYNSLLHPQNNLKRAVVWSIQRFNELYTDEITKLLKEHPIDEIDDEGVPFWGGSRRVPKIIQFDPCNDLHRHFVLWLAVLRYKAVAYGNNSDSETTAPHISINDEKLLSVYASVTSSYTLSNSTVSSSSSSSSSSSVNVSSSTLHHMYDQLLNQEGGGGSKRTPIWKQSQNEINQHSSVSSTSLSSPATTTTNNTLHHVSNDHDFMTKNVTMSMLVNALIGFNPQEIRLLVSSLKPEEFEKDDSTLGHVDFITCASNLRCLAYGIRTADRLEVQRISGKIVPAVVTTTSLVSGLVCLEILKVVSENIRNRKNTILNSFSGTRMNEKSQRKSSNKKNSTLTEMILNFVKSFFQRERKSRKNVSSKNIDDRNGSGDISANLKENERLLQRFRNSFVNVARALVAFSQPVMAETYTHQGHSFNMWDVIELDSPVDYLTVNDLEEYLSNTYNAKLQSVTHGDLMLYAKFLPDAEFMSTLSIAQLLTQARQPSLEDEDEDNTSDNDSDITENNDEGEDDLDSASDSDREEAALVEEDLLSDVFGDGDKHHQVEYIDLIVACQDEDGEDIRLPPVRVYCTSRRSASSETSDIRDDYNDDDGDENKRKFYSDHDEREDEDDENGDSGNSRSSSDESDRRQANKPFRSSNNVNNILDNLISSVNKFLDKIQTNE